MPTIDQTSKVNDSSEQSQSFLAGEAKEAVDNSLNDINPFAFRVAENQHEQHENYPTVRVIEDSTRTIVNAPKLAPTFIQHEVVTGIPFTASFFSLDSSYSKLSSQEKASFINIENHIRDRVSEGKVADSSMAISALIKEWETKINLKDYHDPYYKAERLSEYLDNIAKYTKQQTVKARVFKQAKEVEKKRSENIEREITQIKEAARKQLSQSRKIDSLESKIDTLKPNIAPIERKLNKVIESTQSLSERIQEPDFSPIERRVGQLDNKLTPALSSLATKIDSLLNLNSSAISRSEEATRIATRALQESAQVKSKHTTIKDSLGKLLEGLA